MEHIGLTETIEALRAELGEAVKKAAGAAVQFPVGEISLEFQVGVTKDASAKGGVRFWVVALDGSAGVSAESIQRVKITLEPPVDADGRRVMVSRGYDERP